MNQIKNIFIFLFITCNTIYATSTASLVAKKSNTKGYSYSKSTRLAFIRECSENANQNICYCVLDKIQQQYSEKQYLKLDADLRKNINHKDFISFISNASDVCDAEYIAKNIDDKTLQNTFNEKRSSKITEEEATEYINSILNEASKNIFVSNCASVAKNFYGEKTASKVCGCAYDHMVSDIPRLTQILMDNGFPDDSNENTWLKEYMYECAPEKFTSEIKKTLIHTMNQAGVPQSVSACIINAIEKEYSLQAFIAAAENNFSNDPFFASFINIKASQCLMELETNNYRNNSGNENNNISPKLKSLSSNKKGK